MQGGPLGTQKSTYVIFARPLACMSNDVPQKSRRTKDHSMNAKTLHFCILLCKLAYFMSEYVSLKGGIAHFILMFHALLPQILKYCFCGIFSYVLSVCAIYFAFFRLWSIRQKKETLRKAKRPEVEFKSNLVKSYHKFKHKS